MRSWTGGVEVLGRRCGRPPGRGVYSSLSRMWCGGVWCGPLGAFASGVLAHLADAP